MWVRSWISRRHDSGFFAQLVKELHSEDMNSYANFLRMSNKDYEYLLQKVEPLIRKQDTHLRLAISPSERLMLTLRFSNRLQMLETHRNQPRSTRTI
ncbi:unnamed protein product [Acanthoscelides obtectus]|uniref:Uncharacterized protein n=1 Tax=Acanthoscelides obtectus TaxID=200917 RepID=A0A9P0QB14_ACAOB|nr:unnamed protein product [Acanthoscelides obtectus]CAK1656878.1 hypothetical protein AOBTE_LOCUS19988 [Acanthoscelides obtectus]